VSGDERLPRGEIGIGRAKGGHSCAVRGFGIHMARLREGRKVGEKGEWEAWEKRRSGRQQSSQRGEDMVREKKRKQRGLFVMRCGQSLPGSALSFSAEDLRALMRYGIKQYDRIL
jgi:hypothetical protein